MYTYIHFTTFSEGLQNMTQLAKTPSPPYYAVIFTSVRTDLAAGYAQMAEWMVQLAARQPGFLGVESVRQNGLGITVSYWENEAAITAWKNQVDHQTAQEAGREKWYAHYEVRVARVERAYSFAAEESSPPEFRHG